MLAPWKKSYDKPRQLIEKQRHYFTNKGPSSQSYVFSSSHTWCESWTIKKAELWRIDIFELWCWRRLLRVPWSARGSNQSILKDISPEYSLEGLKLKLQNFGHLIERADSLEKTLKDWGQEEKETTEDEMVRWHHQLNGHEFEQSPGDNEGQGRLVCYSPRDPKESEATEWVNNSNKAFLLYSGH